VVSGLAALLLQADPGLDPGALRSALAAGALDLGAPGRDREFGDGLVQGTASLEAVKDRILAVVRDGAAADARKTLARLDGGFLRELRRQASFRAQEDPGRYGAVAEALGKP
jgi:hypothetical protein